MTAAAQVRRVDHRPEHSPSSPPKFAFRVRMRRHPRQRASMFCNAAGERERALAPRSLAASHVRGLECPADDEEKLASPVLLWLATIRIRRDSAH